MDCNLKKNWAKPVCKKRVGEAHFTIILPKADNSGNKIKPSVFSKYVNKINRHFGGSTTKPKTLGCWVDEKRKKLQCETGFSVETFRDFDIDPDLKKLNSDERKKILQKDYAFMRRLAKQSANELGQDSVPVIFDNISDVSLNKGEWKKSISKKKLTKKKYSPDIWDKEI
jgi:hypothetical protein